MKKKLKIAIVGAGICGLYLAWKLSCKGHQVSVFEKRKEIGKQACSGLFSRRILEFIPQASCLIQNKIDFILTHFPKNSVKIKFSEGFVDIEHRELDKMVAILAEKSGAKINLNYFISHNEIANLLKDFDRIIGCDGPQSFVRKYLGLDDPSLRLAIQGFVVKQSNDQEYTNIVETWARKRGFAWKIPKNGGYEYGIIAGLKQAQKFFKEFLSEHNLQIDEIRAGIVPQGFCVPKHSKITLCGDAAGLTKPWSGGGVVWGLIASEMLLKNFPDFLAYEKAMKRFFLPRIIFSKIATKSTYFFGFHLPWVLPKKVKIEGDFLV